METLLTGRHPHSTISTISVKNEVHNKSSGKVAGLLYCSDVILKFLAYLNSLGELLFS
jgi:hypothetical protein